MTPLIIPAQKLLETTYFFLIYNRDPIQVGHLLLISKEHIKTMTELSNQALSDLIYLEKNLIEFLELSLPIEDMTLIQNNGQLMDKRTHFHVHLIPRYSQDFIWEEPLVKRQEIDCHHLTDILTAYGTTLT